MGLLGSLAGKLLKGVGKVASKAVSNIKENKANRQALLDLQTNVLPRENVTAQQAAAIGIKQIPAVVWILLIGVIGLLIFKKK